MRKIAEQLYVTMQKDLQNCKAKGLDEEKETECCFQICNHYWQQLKRLLSFHHFSSDEEEIDFFKNLKPMFTGEIEYYNLVYHAHLFRPLDQEQKEKFWSREWLRLERFTESNQEFFQYYMDKRSDQDEFYFLRRNNESVDIPEANPELSDRKTCTSHDHLMSQLTALEKYTAYVNSEIKKGGGKVPHGFRQNMDD